MRQIKFIDTTIRDGQASLWAMNMRTHHMLPAMPLLDEAGFDQMEFLAAGSRLKKFVRHLAEDPWDWIKLGAEAAKKTQLRWHGYISSASMSGNVPSEVGELLIRKVVDLGITYTRTGNNWNDFAAAGVEKQRLESLGMTPVINVMYSVSPRHTEYMTLITGVMPRFSSRCFSTPAAAKSFQLLPVLVSVIPRSTTLRISSSPT